MKLTPFYIITLVFFVLALGGCAQNVVHLSYPPAREQVSFPAKKSRVCVVDPENKRGKTGLGTRLSGTPILPRIPVERWLASGIAEELARAGYTVSLAETMADALGSGADYIISGETEEVWLEESSITRFTGTIRSSISLSDGGGRGITTNSYSSVYSKTVLPVYGLPQTLMDEALAEMLGPAIRLLSQKMP